MRIDIITALPSLLDSFLNQSILKRAQDKNVVELVIQDLRNYTPYKHEQVDDYAFGGGAGMVLMPEPLFNCIETLQKERSYDAIIYVTPDGRQFDQKTANRFSLLENIMIICGHYKGIDERVRQALVTHEISIGDFVLSGGELPAAIIADAVIRLIPGVLSDETSALTDSFQDDLLAPPVYTRPAEFRGMKVPEVLLSGHEEKINQWRFEQSVERTKERRPDLYNKFKNNL
jgi:tRNA (guanine37-N1)-methyltransferase